MEAAKLIEGLQGQGDLGRILLSAMSQIVTQLFRIWTYLPEISPSIHEADSDSGFAPVGVQYASKSLSLWLRQ